MTTLEQYHYVSLKSDEVQLLKILPAPKSDTIACQLEHFSLDTLPAYSALSYTWGDEPSNRSIFIENGQFLVKQNLESALLEFRGRIPRLPTSSGKISPSDNGYSFLWIDAICINQEDVAERTAQVKLMKEIYKRANGLLVWLGPAKENSAEGIALLKRFMIERGKAETFETWIRRSEDSSGSVQTGCQAVAALFWRPWFTRAWVVQEYALGGFLTPQGSRAIQVFCGSECIPDIVRIGVLCILQPNFLSRYKPHTVPSGPYGLPSSAPSILPYIITGLLTTRARFDVSNSKEKAYEGPGLYQLLPLVVTSSYASATDPRDKIYAFLGLSEEMYDKPLNINFSKLIIDYNSSVVDVYTSFVQAVVTRTKRLDILGCCMSKHGTNSGGKSWVPDWTINDWSDVGHGFLYNDFYAWNIRPDENTSAGGGFTYDVTQGTECVAAFSDDRRVLTVSGFVWDKVIAVIPLPKKFDAKATLVLRLAFAKFCQMLDLKNEKVHGGDLFGQGKAASDALLFTLTLNRLKVRRREDPSTEWRDVFRDWLTTKSKATPQNTTKPEPSPQDIPSSISSPNPPEPIPKRNTAPQINKILTEFTKSALTTGQFLVVTKEGYFGKCHKKPVKGDNVCIFPGCAMPMILRPFQEYHKLLGEAYVNGIMDGEVMTALGEGKRELREFKIIRERKNPSKDNTTPQGSFLGLYLDHRLYSNYSASKSKHLLSPRKKYA